MATKSLRYHAASARDASAKWSALRPGGWGDRLVFGYMFRVITGLAAVIAPGMLVIVWGSVTGWTMTNAMLYFFGGATVVIVLIGECMRLGVYESRIGLRQRIRVADDYSGITREFLEQHGHATLSYRIAKRLFDICVSVPSVIALSPILLITALLVKFDSHGPTLYRDRKMGFRGSALVLLRFRTLYHETDHPSTAGEVTRVGRFLRATSIDELPQLLNVIFGSMSIVGPRPIPLRRPVTEQQSWPDGFVDPRYELLRYAKPGLTGIVVEPAAHPSRVFDYLLNRSFFNDLKIFSRTFSRLLGR